MLDIILLAVIGKEIIVVSHAQITVIVLRVKNVTPQHTPVFLVRQMVLQHVQHVHKVS